MGDAVLARSEFDPSGPLELKRVEEKFVRTAVVMELVARPVSSSSLSRHALASGSSAIASSRLSLAAGSSAFELAFAEFTQSESGDEPVFATQSIKTTAEHPFYVPALGKFVPAGELQPGDLLISSDDQLIEVVEASSTDEVTTVYNLRVADHHTYFVGGAIWGWDVWVHNASYQVVDIAPGVAISRSLQRRGDRLHQRATEIVGQLSPGYDTVAVARVRDANGHIKTLIATNQTTLPSKIKLRQREEFIGIEGHAESSIMQWLDQNPNWTLDVGAASRNICWRCAGEIQQMGYQIANMKYGSPGARANATDFRVFFRQ